MEGNLNDTSGQYVERWVCVRRVGSDAKWSIPFGAMVLPPDELEERLTMGDQFVEEIVNKGKMLYRAELEVKDG